MSVSSLL